MQILSDNAKTNESMMANTEKCSERDIWVFLIPNLSSEKDKKKKHLKRNEQKEKREKEILNEKLKEKEN